MIHKSQLQAFSIHLLGKCILNLSDGGTFVSFYDNDIDILSEIHFKLCSQVICE